MTTPLTRVHAAIVKVCPEIGGTCSSCGKKNPLASELCDPPSLPHCNVRPRPATLADVLRAIKVAHLNVENTGINRFIGQIYNLCMRDWNLEHDSLEWHAKHRPETISFLESILCK